MDTDRQGRRGNRRQTGWWLAAVVVIASVGCGAPTLPDDSDADSEFNIAGQILPGEWRVLNEPAIFRFDEQGIPVEISNPDDPNDWKTNIEFGTSRRIETPIGALDFVFEPGRPKIDSRTGEASFSALGIGTNINALGIPIIGSGYATAVFTGSYDANTGELTGTIRYEVFYEAISIYADEDAYTLIKIQ